jgi:transcriptional regulator with XRE-family HTH domain
VVQDETAELLKRLGRNVANRRKQLGITQDSCAEQLGLEPASVSRIERGLTSPSLRTLQKLSSLLQISIGELLEEPSASTPAAVEQIAAWLQLVPEQDRQFLLDLIRQTALHLGKK